VKIGEFFVELFVKSEKGQLSVKELVSTFGELEAATVAEAGALADLAFKFVGLAEQAYNAAAAFQMFESQTGLSSQELQKWQIVAEQANVSTEAMASGINALQRNLAEIRLGRGNIAPFQMLGIGPNQNAFQVLDQLRDRIKGLDSATATNIITQMGLSPETIQVLRLSNQEFSKLAATEKSMSVNQERSFLEGKQSLVRFEHALKEAGYGIVELFGPAFTELLKSSAFYINKMSEAFGYVVKHIGNFKAALIGLAVVLSPLFIETFPITAALLALILVLDDLATYFQGGDSVTGLAIKGLKSLGDALSNALPASATAVLDKLASVFSIGINPLAGLMGPAQAAVAGAAGMVVNQTNHVTVNTTDARQGGAIAGKKVMDGFSQAQQQLNKQGK
jgi:hypothetical protein